MKYLQRNEKKNFKKLDFFLDFCLKLNLPIEKNKMNLLNFPDPILTRIVGYCRRTFLGATCRKFRDFLFERIEPLETKEIFQYCLKIYGNVPKHLWVRECRIGGKYKLMISECKTCPRMMIYMFWKFLEDSKHEQFRLMSSLEKFRDTFVGFSRETDLERVEEMIWSAVKNNDIEMIKLIQMYYAHFDVLQIAIPHIIMLKSIKILDYFRILHEEVFLYAIEWGKWEIFDWAIKNKCKVSILTYEKLLQYGHLDQLRELHKSAQVKLIPSMYKYGMKQNTFKLAEWLYE